MDAMVASGVPSGGCDEFLCCPPSLVAIEISPNASLPRSSQWAMSEDLKGDRTIVFPVGGEGTSGAVVPHPPSSESVLVSLPVDGHRYELCHYDDLI